MILIAPFRTIVSLLSSKIYLLFATLMPWLLAFANPTFSELRVQ